MNHALFVRTATAVLALSFSAFAEEGFTDPDAAGPDFAVQGEYAGHECGAQVIALGEGKFHIVGWDKGLPGTADDVEKTAEVDAQRAGERIVFDGSGWKGAIEDGRLTATNTAGEKVELKRIERASPTLSAKPPAGATVLFDGTNADAWEGGKMDARKLLFCGTKSKRSFGDCTLHLEFRTPFMPAALLRWHSEAVPVPRKSAVLSHWNQADRPLPSFSSPRKPMDEPGFCSRSVVRSSEPIAGATACVRP